MIKKALVALALLAPTFALAQEAAPAEEPKTTATASTNAPTWKLSLALDFEIDAVAIYDFQNHDVLAGYQKNLFTLDKNGKKRFYLAGNHVFNANEEGKGAIGLSLGAYTGDLGDRLEAIASAAMPGQADLFHGISKISNYCSVEVSGGYRPFGNAVDTNPWYWGVGGKVKIPLW